VQTLVDFLEIEYTKLGSTNWHDYLPKTGRSFRKFIEVHVIQNGNCSTALLTREWGFWPFCPYHPGIEKVVHAGDGIEDTDDYFAACEKAGNAFLDTLAEERNTA
jgi:hypothetical protein